MNTTANAAPTPARELEQHRRAVKKNPRDARAHALLAMALQKQGRYLEAIASHRRALALDPKLVALHGILAAALYAVGEHDASAEHYRRALAAAPDDPELARGLALALRKSVQPNVALEQARAALALAPDDLDALLGLAEAQYGAKDFAGAAQSFARVTERAPGMVAAWIDRGQSERLAHRPQDALASLTRALALAPDDAKILGYLGQCQRELNLLAEAQASLERATALDPGNASHWCELGVALQMRGRMNEALAALTRSQQINPHDALLLRALSQNHFDTGRWEEALRVTRMAMQHHPAPDVHSTLLFILSHFTEDPDELTREHLAYAERWEAPLRAGWQAHPNPRDPQRRIRVGFVSADMRNHAVSRFVEPVFAQLRASEQLEFFVYYNHADVDSMTEQLRAYMPNWRPIVHLSDDEAEALIRADGIDILVDLSGHSAANRLPLFARKPAPVQASWIGYAGTTGLQAMDYYVSDAFHLPEGRYDDQFSERIVRLPLIAPFLPPPVAADVNPLPALENGYLTFGSFHRASKISRATIALWSELLRNLPTSRLLLGGQQSGTEETVLGWLDEEGIDRSRILVRQRAPVHEYMRQHHEVDICLSPFPYSGSTTICYALWMGVPTLFTVGATNPSHSAVCYLAHLGLSSFLADDRASFVALGRFLEQNLPTLAALRGTMRQRFLDSVVGYPGVTAASLEHAMRLMWQRWCAGEAAAPLRVRLADVTGEGAQQ